MHTKEATRFRLCSANDLRRDMPLTAVAALLVALSLADASGWGPTQWYESSLKGLDIVARAQTRFLQSGYLRYYLLTTLVSAFIVVVFVLPIPSSDS